MIETRGTARQGDFHPSADRQALQKGAASADIRSDASATGPTFGKDELLAELERARTRVAELKARCSEHDRSLQRLRDLNRLREDLLRPGSLGDKLDRITSAVVRIFDADFCRIWITHPGDLCESGCIHAEVLEGPHVCRLRSFCLHLVASSGRYTHKDGRIHRRVPFGCYKIGRVAADLEPKFITNDVTRDPRGRRQHGRPRDPGERRSAGGGVKRVPDSIPRGAGAA
jgi:hypothetical protein